jgi:hypothetical protein
MWRAKTSDEKLRTAISYPLKSSSRSRSLIAELKASTRFFQNFAIDQLLPDICDVAFAQSGRFRQLTNGPCASLFDRGEGEHQLSAGRTDALALLGRAILSISNDGPLVVSTENEMRVTGLIEEVYPKSRLVTVTGLPASIAQNQSKGVKTDPVTLE